MEQEKERVPGSPEMIDVEELRKTAEAAGYDVPTESEAAEARAQVAEAEAGVYEHDGEDMAVAKQVAEDESQERDTSGDVEMIDLNEMKQMSDEMKQEQATPDQEETPVEKPKENKGFWAKLFGRK